MAVQPDGLHSERVAADDVSGDVVADVHAFRRGFASPATSFQKNAAMRLTETNVFGKYEDREILRQAGALQLLNLLIAGPVRDDSERFFRQRFQTRRCIIVGAGQQLIFADKEPI